MDILIQEQSNDKHVQLPEDTDAVLHSMNTPTPFLIKKCGLGLTEPPKDESWHSVVRMELANNKLSELPLSPSSPELKVLMLQGNVELARIPNTFFCKMPLLSILDLSYTSVRELPGSLFELELLRQLYLKGCDCFMKLSPKIGKLKKLEKLDLDGTQIIHLPEEIQELTNLQSLFLCFYEYRGRKGKQYTSPTIIQSEVISKLKGLKHLRIDVNPDDERWYENVRDILPEILGLEHLLTLSLYIPHLELLKAIPDYMFQVDFRFIVGRHMQKILSSTPSTCEAKFKQSGCSLRFVDGDVIPNEIKRLVGHSKALFLERHKTIKNLSEFKLMNLEQLRVCMLAECREMQTVIDGRQSNRTNDIFSHLLYLYISHMKSLRSIWEGPVPPHCFLGMLKSLVLQNCPELTTVFTMYFLGNLSLLKELIVKDCPKVTTLISDRSFGHKRGVFLPKLRKIILLHLPELITISNGCCIGPSLNKIAIYDCPRLQSFSKWELSSQSLKIIQGEMKWWDQLQWREEWGILQRPSRFDRIFSSVNNQVDIMTQIGIDDDIDDDEDMTLLQTLFGHPKQNADRISRRTSPESRKISEDGYNWRKYGQKTEGSKNIRHFYKCTYAGCLVKKKVQISEDDPRIIETVYKGEHTHISPLYNRSLCELQSRGIVGDPLPSSCVTNASMNNQVDLRAQFEGNKVDIMTHIGNDGDDISDEAVDHPRQNANSFSSDKQNAKRLTFRVPSEVGFLEDGYRWRKYGQKLMDGSKNPRHYFKCAYAGCSVKKRVQRSEGDPKMIEICYEGIHTHPSPQYNRSLHGLQSIGETVSSEPLYPSNDKVGKNKRSLSQRTEVFDDDGYRWRKYDQEDIRGLPTLRKDEAEKTFMIPALQFGNMDVLPEDGYTWRKYGQKEILGSNYSRSYFRCTHQKLYQCPAKKQVQRLDSNPNIFAVTYRGSHTCQMSSTAPSSSVPPKLIISQQLHDITQITATTSSQLSSSSTSVSGWLSFVCPGLTAGGCGSSVTPAGAEACVTGPSMSSSGADYLAAGMADAMFNSGSSIGSNNMQSLFSSIDEEWEGGVMEREK